MAQRQIPQVIHARQNRRVEQVPGIEEDRVILHADRFREEGRDIAHVDIHRHRQHGFQRRQHDIAHDRAVFEHGELGRRPDSARHGVLRVDAQAHPADQHVPVRKPPVVAHHDVLLRRIGHPQAPIGIVEQARVKWSREPVGPVEDHRLIDHTALNTVAARMLAGWHQRNRHRRPRLVPFRIIKCRVKSTPLSHKRSLSQ